jgi:hypothetical protein
MSELAEVYLSENEFCARFRVAPRTAQRWRRAGDGPLWVRAGFRRVLYRLSDCEKWADGRTFRHRADELSRVS